MKYLVDLWQACSSRDAEQLRQFVSWRGKKLERRRRGDDPYELFISRELESFEKHRDEREAEFYKAGDHYKPARDMLFRRVNGALEVLTFQAAVANESLELKVTAESLYTIALSQFALAVVERWEVKYCQRCGLPFSEAESRIDRAFCSDSCRVLACRDRKKRAIELHARGKDVRSIVEEVGSDLKTVKNWLKIKESPDDAKKKRKR